MKNRSELGRSMVEILSVLSVMGVLTVGAFIGYSFLMKKHRNNQLLHETTLRAVVASSQMLSGKDPNIDSFGNVLGHEISLKTSPTFDAFALVDEEGEEVSFNEVPPKAEDKEFALELTNVPPEVCEYFVQIAASNGVIQGVYGSSGKELSLRNCREGEYVSSGDTGSSSGRIYLVYRSDMAQTKGKEVQETLGDETDTLCSEKGEVIGDTVACNCDRGFSGDRCSEESEACSGHGYWYYSPLTSKCICDEGYEGSKCEGMVAYSPCQTLTMEEGKEVRGFKANGTTCTQAGRSGTCDGRGHCNPSGKSCNGISDCGNGQFCNYGGIAGKNQGGMTPNICEQTNSEYFEYDGIEYYYNSDSDLRSWCRAADNQANCTWGFLSYYGAQSWCESLGLELVDGEYIQSNCDEFKKHLPQVGSDQQYWVAGQKVVHLGDKCSIQEMVRTDGYAWAGGVVCAASEKKIQPDTSNALSNFEGKECNFSGYCHTQDGTYYTLVKCAGGVVSSLDGCDSATDETCPSGWQFGPACNTITINEEEGGEEEEGCAEGQRAVQNSVTGEIRCCAEDDGLCQCDAQGSDWVYAKGQCCMRDDTRCICGEDTSTEECCVANELVWKDGVCLSEDESKCELMGGSWFRGTCCTDASCCKNLQGLWGVNSYTGKSYCCPNAFISSEEEYAKCFCEAESNPANPSSLIWGKWYGRALPTCCASDDEWCKCTAQGENYQFISVDGKHGTCCDTNDEECNCVAYNGIYKDGTCCSTNDLNCVISIGAYKEIKQFLAEMSQVSSRLRRFNPPTDLSGDRRELVYALEDIKRYADIVASSSEQLSRDLSKEPDSMGLVYSDALATIISIKKDYETKDFESKFRELIGRIKGSVNSKEIVSLVGEAYSLLYIKEGQQCNSDGGKWVWDEQKGEYNCVATGKLTSDEEEFLNDMKESYEMLKDLEITQEDISAIGRLAEVLLEVKALSKEVADLSDTLSNPSNPGYAEAVLVLRARRSRADVLWKELDRLSDDEGGVLAYAKAFFQNFGVKTAWAIETNALRKALRAYLKKLERLCALTGGEWVSHDSIFDGRCCPKGEWGEAYLCRCLAIPNDKFSYPSHQEEFCRCQMHANKTFVQCLNGKTYCCDVSDDEKCGCETCLDNTWLGPGKCCPKGWIWIE